MTDTTKPQIVKPAFGKVLIINLPYDVYLRIRPEDLDTLESLFKGNMYSHTWDSTFSAYSYTKKSDSEGFHFKFEDAELFEEKPVEEIAMEEILGENNRLTRENSLLQDKITQLTAKLAKGVGATSTSTEVSVL